jgi:hypothetical protein
VIENGGMTSSLSTNVLSITPPLNYYGETNITVAVSDGEYVDSTDFTLTVNAVNDAPIVSQSLEDIILLEDSETASVVLSSYFGDVDSDTLFYNVDLNINDIITAEISGETLIINTLQNQYGGPVIAMITASDQSGGTPASDNFEIMITGVNDPPILSQIDDQTINEDSHLVYSLSANDVDGDILIYDGQISGNGIINTTGNILSVTPTPDYYGDIDITISVSDDEYTDSIDFTLTVNAVNDAPIVSHPLENMNLLEDSEAASVVLSPFFTDIDGDSLVYNATISEEEIISTAISGDTLTISTNEDAYGGPVIVSITANDLEGRILVSTSFDVTVIPVNDAPTISTINNQEIVEDGIFIYSLDATDLDGDQLFFSANIDSTLGTLFIDGNILKIIPIEDYNGAFEVNVLVSDGIVEEDQHWGQHSTDFTLTVHAVNDAPIVSQPQEDIELLEDSGVTTILLSNVFSDVDGDNLIFEAAINLNGIIFIDLIGNNLNISTLTDQFGGPITVTITADDQQGTTPVIDQFEVTVMPVNDPLTIISIPDSTAWEDIEYTYHVELEDVDSDIFYFNLGQAPEGMAVDNRGGLLTWTPLEGVLTTAIPSGACPKLK